MMTSTEAQQLYGSSVTTWAWNGPVCPSCGANYLGQHTCQSDDLIKRANELLEQALRTQKQESERGKSWLRSRESPIDWQDGIIGCQGACRPENGGSGSCMNVMCGPRIIC